MIIVGQCSSSTPCIVINTSRRYCWNINKRNICLLLSVFVPLNPYTANTPFSFVYTARVCFRHNSNVESYLHLATVWNNGRTKAAQGVVHGVMHVYRLTFRCLMCVLAWCVACLVFGVKRSLLCASNPSVPGWTWGGGLFVCFRMKRQNAKECDVLINHIVMS